MEEWKEYKLGDVCKMIPGFAFKSNEFGKGSNVAIKIKDIQPPYVETKGADNVDISRYDLDKLSKFIVHKGEFLLAMTGATIGKIGKYIDERPAYINQRVLKFQDTGFISYDYLYYYLSTNIFQSFILNHIDSQSAQPNISSNTIGKYPIKVPSFNTQQKIASILKSLDDKIEVNRRINENLEQQAQALFKSWFVDFDPFKDQPFVDSELGMIPQGWRVGRLCDISYYSKDRIRVNELDNDNYYSTENMLPNKMGVTRATNLPNIEYTTRCKPGDIIISNIRPYFKKIYFCDCDIAGCSTDVLCFVPIKKTMSIYLYSILYNDCFFEYMVMGARGTKMPRGDKQQIMNYRVIIPNEDSINQFTNIVSPIIRIKKRYELESRRLAELRDALLPRLMSGEIKVEDATL